MMATPDRSGVTPYTTPSDHEIEVTRVFDAPCRLVWAAWTDAAHVPHWMLGPEGWTMPVCQIDLRVGGAWHFVWRQSDGHQSDGTEMEMRGVYQEVVPPQRLVATESWGGDWPETVNTVTLTERDGRTTMTQRIWYPSEAARDSALGTGMTDGMSTSFDRLNDYLPAIG